MDRTIGAISQAAHKAILANGGRVIPDPEYPHLLMVTFSGEYVTERHTPTAEVKRHGSWSEYDYRLSDGTKVTVSGHRSPNGYGSGCIFLTETRKPSDASRV